ncbi:hypothetical protein Y032_0019g3889 [Ancylostoma ceylanicum]|uniref:Secreted protein n=1 Tax=Ancylostoma ceylanicum TaxID=53326 RepID=A0A016V4C5_9BILA|nr:hypothetical protein Y032_0019g3889 [Ancylostoma ceylanicum]
MRLLTISLFCLLVRFNSAAILNLRPKQVVNSSKRLFFVFNASFPCGVRNHSSVAIPLVLHNFLSLSWTSQQSLQVPAYVFFWFMHLLLDRECIAVKRICLKKNSHKW